MLFWVAALAIFSVITLAADGPCYPDMHTFDVAYRKRMNESQVVLVLVTMPFSRRGEYWRRWTVGWSAKHDEMPPVLEVNVEHDRKARSLSITATNKLTSEQVCCVVTGNSRPFTLTGAEVGSVCAISSGCDELGCRSMWRLGPRGVGSMHRPCALRAALL